MRLFHRWSRVRRQEQMLRVEEIILWLNFNGSHLKSNGCFNCVMCVSTTLDGIRVCETGAGATVQT